MQPHLQPRQPSHIPPPFEYVIAETPQGRYVGFVDRRGRWFRAVNNTPISDVTGWYAVGSTAAKRKEPPMEELESSTAA